VTADYFWRESRRSDNDNPFAIAILKLLAAHQAHYSCRSPVAQFHGFISHSKSTAELVPELVIVVILLVTPPRLCWRHLSHG
jgi:hypothetical protein